MQYFATTIADQCSVTLYSAIFCGFDPKVRLVLEVLSRNSEVSPPAAKCFELIILRFKINIINILRVQWRIVDT
jgi:hypothetical protein